MHAGSQPPDGKDAKPNRQGLKFLIDLVPLLAFFTAFRFFGIVEATGVLIGATLLALIASKVLLGKIDAMLIVTATIVTVFGGLTFAFGDARFIKMKPTVVNLLFAATLSFGLLTGRLFLKSILGEALHLTNLGWRLLTQRWIAFFVVLAGLNEIVWRTYNTPATEHVWVNFKVFGILGLTVLYLALQTPLLRRHAAPTSKPN
jgi:intracellular septation protein